ncbi:MAG: hypothetical protein U9R17_15295 [Thermodesulfobacteriota bacterium]|nr:hypothetical protein [Thermodesulfobacteriota bacterium]
MLREIIKPTSESYNIRIPKEYLNQEVEILVLPLGSYTGDSLKNIEVKAYANHSANTIDEWKDSSEDEIWK